MGKWMSRPSRVEIVHSVILTTLLQTLILMSLLNDFAVTSSSKDQVMIQRKPQTLDIWKVATTASVMALISSLQVWAFMHSILKHDATESQHFWGLKTSDGSDNFSGCEAAAFNFLVLIVTLQLDLIAARSPKPFWLFSTEKDDSGQFTGIPPPSFYVISAISISLTIATLIAVYWEDNIVIGSGYGMQGMTWRNAGLTWAWAIMWFVITDLCKTGVVALVKKMERDKAKGKTLWMNLYRNVMEQDWDEDKSDQEKKLQREELRQFLTTFEGHESLRSSISMGSTFLPMALAANLQQVHEEEEAIVPLSHQHELLAIQTLQDDPALLRIISGMAHHIAELQKQVEELTKKLN
jgi:hypothetical protein